MAEIALRDVTKSYGATKIIHGIDAVLKDGEFVVILGPSGCGKSTLLRMIAGLEEITGGEIAIGGARVNEMEPHERGCAMVFQNYALYPHMTVAENIGYALKVAGVPKDERARRVEAVAKTLGLGDYLARKPAQLSGGQRQRVAMGRAMIREPKVFLFDEPLSNLDAKLRVQMRIEIRKLHNRLKATSIFVTHDQVEAMTLADRLIVMNGGRVEQVGTPAEVYAKPATVFVAGFIGSPPMNLVPARIENGALLLGGARLPLPFAPAGETLAGVRPEAVRLAEPGAANAARLEVDFTEELGPSRLCHGTVGGEDFVVEVPTAAVPRDVRTLDLAIPADAVALFDAKTGRRLDAEPALAAA